MSRYKMKNNKPINLKNGAVIFGLISFLLFMFVVYLVYDGITTGEIYDGAWRTGSEDIYASKESMSFRYYYAIIFYSALSSGLFYGVIWSYKFYKEQK